MCFNFSKSHKTQACLTTGLWNSLGVGLLQKSAPELPRCGRATEEQDAVPADRKTIVHHHVHPTAEPPEPEMKDSSVQVGMLRIPLLIAVIGNHLARRGGGGVGVWRQGKTQIGLRGTQVQHLLPQWRLWGQAGNGSHHPAVPQTALVKVSRADAVHKQARVLTDLLEQEGQENKKYHNAINTGQFS